MTYDVISYILIGSIFTAVMVPLIALLRNSIKEQKRLDEVKTAKKAEPHGLEEKQAYAYMD